MLILLFIAAALNLSASSAPISNSIDTFDPLPLSILGRDISIPECINPARYRTMQQIVLSCLATIFTCTWVSLHPNVPDPRKSDWQNFTMRMRTMFWALIGPEFITIWAFRQRKAAAEHVEKYIDRHKLTPQPRSIVRRISNLFRAPKSGNQLDRPWTLTHGFLLEMQGLVRFRNGEPSGFTQIDGRPGVVSSIDDLEGQRFNMSESEIKDKSKGDFFTKLIVVTQTSWFIIQCVARWIQRLHVTELEIVTLAFAVLNIVTYGLWWDKPQNMCVAIPVSKTCEGCGVAVEKRDKDGSRNTTKSYPSSDQGSLEDQSSSMEEQVPLLSKERDVHAYGTSIHRVYSTLSHFVSMLGHAILDLPHACWVFIRAINPFSAYGIMIGDDLDFGASDVKAAFYSSTGGTGKGNTVAFAVGLTGLLFGGVHLLPIWLSTFSSTREKTLWIASTICVLVEPVLVSFVVPVFVRLWMFLGSPGIFIPILAFPHTIGFLLYVIARLILIVLAFTSLRSLPPNAFVNVEWSTFFPHV